MSDPIPSLSWKTTQTAAGLRVVNVQPAGTHPTGQFCLFDSRNFNNGHILRLPNPYMLINTIALQEAKTSTEIENIFTTEDDLYKAISETAKHDNVNPGTKEVLRYREALWAGYEAISRKKVVDIQSIITIYQQIKLTKTGFRPPTF